MEPTQIVLIAGILALGVVLQGAVGFGSGMFAVPLMVLSGVDLPVAISVLLAAVTMQTAYGTWHYRHHVPWRVTIEMTLSRYLTLPLGVYTLTFLADAGRDRAKQMLGIVLLAVVLVQLVVRVRPQQHLHAGWTPLAGMLSGFMAGAFGMGGPPLVLWTMAHDWPSRKSRAFLWSTFLLVMPLQLGLLAFAFSWPAVNAFIIGLALSPLIIIAAMAGSWLGDLLDRHRLRIIAFSFLVLIAISAILAPLT